MKKPLSTAQNFQGKTDEATETPVQEQLEIQNDGEAGDGLKQKNDDHMLKAKKVKMHGMKKPIRSIQDLKNAAKAMGPAVKKPKIAGMY